MKRILKWSLLMMLTAFVCVSCNEDSDSPLKRRIVVMPSISSGGTNNAITPLVYEKLKELKFISSYDKLLVGWKLSSYQFSQDGVENADAQRVLQELLDRANTHYAKATEDVKNFDFNSLTGLPDIYFFEHTVWITMPDEKKTQYVANIRIQKPLIFDKKWERTTEDDCPVTSFLFNEKERPTGGTITLSDGTTVDLTTVLRANAILRITTADFIYTFKVGTDSLQLTKYKAVGGIDQDVTGKNYIFTAIVD
ncbi:MAG: hypothetical protein ACRCZY_08040 [Phocaeicola sp.]